MTQRARSARSARPVAARPAAAESTPVAPATALQRKRLSTVERERQILDGAIRFFSDRGLDGQLRELAQSLGITHTLLYHYFPTKQALIDRVYREMFEGLWKTEWEQLLDDPKLDAQTKFTRFYVAYAQVVLERDFVRILVFSGLSDRSIPDRFFGILRERLFPRLIRETRRHCGVASRGKPNVRELEQLMGLHGAVFYIGVRRWIYGQTVHGVQAAGHDETSIADLVQGYLTSAAAVLYPPRAAD